MWYIFIKMGMSKIGIVIEYEGDFHFKGPTFESRAVGNNDLIESMILYAMFLEQNIAFLQPTVMSIFQILSSYL